MFTGLIQEVGKIINIIITNQSYKLTVSCNEVLKELNIGDSIAVNGICLTVTKFNNFSFDADVMHETISKTSLKNVYKGFKVNLERAMSSNHRFNGHIVSGHIDGTGKIIKSYQDGIAKWIYIKTEKNILKYVVLKGSIAIDGISLTVAKLGHDYFALSLIPHTIKNTNLIDKKIGDIVNIENDCVGKYIERFSMFNKEKENKLKELLMDKR